MVLFPDGVAIVIVTPGFTTIPSPSSMAMMSPMRSIVRRVISTSGMVKSGIPSLLSMEKISRPSMQKE